MSARDRALLTAVVILAACSPLLGQSASLANARFQRKDAAAGLEKAFRDAAAAQSGPAWIAWPVPAVGRPHMCCYRSTDEISSAPCSGRCDLENEGRNVSFVDSDDGDCRDRTGSSTMLVFLRVERQEPERLRTFSLDCTIDAGGLPVVWLDDVKPAESVAFLDSLIGNESLSQKKRSKGSEPALSAIAMHDDPAADAVLERRSAPSNPESLRKHAIFWLGSARGRRGYEVLANLARHDESDAIRKSVTFGLSQSKIPEATNTLLGMARRDASPTVRGQALFWLAQKAGKKAAGAIQDAIRDDPETDVKKKAVFALTQMPDNEGIPLLIEVARTNRNPEVRRQAVFWLGQSKDPRAFDFIEEVLKK
jgi:HEAT repeats